MRKPASNRFPLPNGHFLSRQFLANPTPTILATGSILYMPCVTCIISPVLFSLIASGVCKGGMCTSTVPPLLTSRVLAE